MLLQIQDGAQALTLRGGLQKMAAEGINFELGWTILKSQIQYHLLIAL